MNEIIQIKYGIQLNVDDKDLEYEVEEIDLNEEFESEEERLQAEKDKIEEEKFAEEWTGFWKKRIEKENMQSFTYTVNKSLIKYERNQNQLPEEFIRIIPESGIMQHFYKDKKTNEAKITKFNLHHNPDSSDWQIDYKIEEIKSEKKTILGYDCHKMNIEQKRINEKENWKIVNKYELFVTDKINLPARLVIHLWEPVTELCALEIKTINMDSPNSFSVQRAIEIKKEVDEDKLELPKEYANLLIEKNKK
jgi:hypothetical protein